MRLLEILGVWFVANALLYGVSLFGIQWWYALPLATIVTALLCGGGIYLYRLFRPVQDFERITR